MTTRKIAACEIRGVAPIIKIYELLLHFQRRQTYFGILELPRTEGRCPRFRRHVRPRRRLAGSSAPAGPSIKNTVQ